MCHAEGGKKSQKIGNESERKEARRKCCFKGHCRSNIYLEHLEQNKTSISSCPDNLNTTAIMGKKKEKTLALLGRCIML